MKNASITFVLLFVAAMVVVGCSSRGGGVPPIGAGGAGLQDDAAARRHAGHARIYLRIPPRTHRRARDPHYISAATKSLTIAVSASNGYALPPQTFTVKTPSPCAVIPGGGGALKCTFDVLVVAGKDNFTIKTYAGASGSGSLLSQYVTPTATPLPASGGSLAFTLEGVVDHVIMQYPATVVTTDTTLQTGGVPVGTAASTPITITPYDAGGYAILSQTVNGTPVPYAAPFTVTVSPAPGVMSLSNAAGSGSSITIANPNDLAAKLVYNGTFAASSGTVTTAQSYTLTASGSTFSAVRRPGGLRPHPAAGTPTPAPNTAKGVLIGNAVSYPLSGSYPSPDPAGMVNVPSSSNMFFAASTFNGSYGGVMGLLNTTTGTTTSTTLSFSPLAPYVDSAGHFWLWDSTDSQIDCFTSASSSTPSGTISATSFAPVGAYVSSLYAFKEDINNNLWFVVYGAYVSSPGSWYSIGYIPIDASACTAPAASVNQTISPDYVDVNGITANPAGGAFVAISDSSAASSSLYVAATPAVGTTPTLTQNALPSGQTLSSLVDPTASTYGIVATSPGYVLGQLSATGTFSSISTFPTGLGDIYATLQSSASSTYGPFASTSQSSQYDANFVEFTDPTNANAASNWDAGEIGSYCNGTAYDSQGFAWVFCIDAARSLAFYRVIPTSTWAVVPGTTIPVAINAYPATASFFFGVLENLASTSGPFTLSNYDTSEITSATPVGDRGLALTFSFPANGTYDVTADVNDAHGNVVPITFAVTVTDTEQPRHPRARPGTRERAP